PGLPKRRLGVGAAALEELEDMGARGAAQRLAELTGLQFHEGLGEELREPVLAAPAEDAALEGIGRVGIARGDAPERCAALDLAQRLLGALTRLADALRTRALGHPHEDVRDVEF